MTGFPVVDPIPLPAPVWLFKGLHGLTLALHFTALEILLGSILVAVWLNARGVRHPDAATRDTLLQAAHALARRLPVVMTFVINLGVPPLLFTQVLYGRALYTSSILIGVYWIGVIALLTLCYWLLYRFATRTESGRPAWLPGLASWLLAAAIAKIYVTNMTLLLRPGVWNDLYSQSALGLRLPTGDPTVLSRWLFMLTGGLVAAGLWMIWLAARPSFEPRVRACLAGIGGRLAFGMVLVQAVLAFFVFHSQPEAVKSALASRGLCQGTAAGWLVAAAGIAGVAAWSAVRKPASALAGWLGAALGLGSIACMTVYRDALRDITLGLAQFDVWQRHAVTNWGVVGVFLAVTIAGLVAMAWLISVMRRAQPLARTSASSVSSRASDPT